MRFFERLLTSSRTIGCSATKGSTVSDELMLMSIDRKQYELAMSIILGKNWSKVPTREMMNLINMRFGGTSINYSNKEVASIIHLLKSHVDDLSVGQLTFLRENDYLPRSEKADEGVWMDKDELLTYKREKEDVIHKKKMDYFIAMHGTIAAYAQAFNDKPQSKKQNPFKLSMLHTIIVAIVILGLITMIVL